MPRYSFSNLMPKDIKEPINSKSKIKSRYVATLCNAYGELSSHSVMP